MWGGGHRAVEFSPSPGTYLRVFIILLLGLDLYGTGAYAIDSWNPSLPQWGAVCQFHILPVSVPVRLCYHRARSERFIYGGPFDSLVGYERFSESFVGVGSFYSRQLSVPWFLNLGVEASLGLDVNMMVYFNPFPPACWYYLPVPNSGIMRLTGGLGVAIASLSWEPGLTRSYLPARIILAT